MSFSHNTEVFLPASRVVRSTIRCQWCSNSVDILDCYDLHYSSECVGCSESYFLHDCRGCRNCFGGVNLRSEEYYFFNQPCSREEYFRKLEGLRPFSTDTVQQANRWLENQKRTACIFPELFGFKNEDVSGNHIYESKNVHDSFDVKQAEDCRYCFTIFGQEHCYSSHHLFGCHGLRNASYCIFNKQYSREDYLILTEKIRQHMLETGEWGEFFPSRDSPFAYNESVAQEYLPLTKEQVFARGLRWKEDAPEQTRGLAHEGVFRCRQSGREFRVIEPEADFHLKLGLPLPDLSPACRHENRMRQRGARELQTGACGCCGRLIRTSQTGELVGRVYCLDCYERALYGS